MAVDCRQLQRPTSGNVPEHLKGVSVETAGEDLLYNCLGFCLGVRAWVTWLDADPDAPSSAARTLEALGYRRGDHRDSGTTILLYDSPRRAHSHVVKRLYGDLCESKCGPGPRILLRRPERWHDVAGCEGSVWHLDAAKHAAALSRLEPYQHDGRTIYRVSIGLSPASAPPPLDTLPDILQDCGIPISEAISWLEAELDRAR